MWPHSMAGILLGCCFANAIRSEVIAFDVCIAARVATIAREVTLRLDDRAVAQHNIKSPVLSE